MKLRGALFAFLLSFIAVICALRWWESSAYPPIIWQACGAIVLCAILLAIFKRARPIALGIAAGTLGIACALFSVQRTTHVTLPSSIEQQADETKKEIEGRVVNIDARETSIRYILQTTKHTGKLLLITHTLWPRFQYGDTVSAFGIVEKPEAFDGFAYDEFLSVSDVYALMRPITISLVKEGSPSPMRLLMNLRQNVSTLLGTLFPEPHASLLDGLLTGNRSSVPPDVMQDFTTTGLTHLLAISGYNIAVVLVILSSLLFFLPQRWRLVPSIVAIVAFTLFTGASASVVRAAIMGILSLLALHSGRLNNTRLAVLWTAFFMLAWNPKQAWFDPSFQLSFLCVIGLIECQPLLVRFLHRVPETLGLRDALALTLSAQLFASPWGMLLFGQIAPIAPLSNLLVPPFVPFAMGTGALALIAGALWTPLGLLFAFPCWVLLQLILTLTHWIALIPYASIITPQLSPWLIAAYYVCLGTVIMIARASIHTPRAPHAAIHS